MGVQFGFMSRIIELCADLLHWFVFVTFLCSFFQHFLELSLPTKILPSVSFFVLFATHTNYETDFACVIAGRGLRDVPNGACQSGGSAV